MNTAVMSARKSAASAAARGRARPNKQMSLAQTRLWVTMAHGDQKYGDAPYSKHTLGVEQVAVRFGFGRSICIRKICLGHDVIEDTPYKAEEMLAAGFTRIQVRAIEGLSDGPGETRAERKAPVYVACRHNRRTLIGKLCDRIYNVEAGGKIEMYRHEHPEFERLCRDRSDLELEPMWLHLEDLFRRAA